MYLNIFLNVWGWERNEARRDKGKKLERKQKRDGEQEVEKRLGEREKASLRKQSSWK